MEVRDLVLKYLKAKKVMQLATARDGQPWICTVHYWADDKQNLYWISYENSRHSKDVKDNSRVAAAIVVQTDEAVAGTPIICIHCEGTAETVDVPEEFQSNLRRYFDYQHKPEKLYEKIMSGEEPLKLYRLKPSLFVLFDVQNFPKSPRQEWRID